MTSQGAGKLVLVATPIGNLGDMTVRAREVLQSAHAVLAEDTRVTGKLLAALGIQNRLERLDENMMASRTENVVARVLSGEMLAYCSDAGMPGVSDPGMRLVAAVRSAGGNVEVLPGPSAAATAYVTSGFTCPRYYFGGFLPRKSAQIRTALSALATLDAVLVFYESPRRVVATLQEIAEVFPKRQVAVCRELTKLHEEVVCAMAADVAAEFSQRAAKGEIKGEIALVIDAPTAAEEHDKNCAAIEQARDLAKELMAQGATRKDIAKALAAEYGIARNEAYDIALELSGR